MPVSVLGAREEGDTSAVGFQQAASQLRLRTAGLRGGSPNVLAGACRALRSGRAHPVFDAQRVVATASGPTFAAEGAGVNILLLTGALLLSCQAPGLRLLLSGTHSVTITACTACHLLRVP